MEFLVFLWDLSGKEIKKLGVITLDLCRKGWKFTLHAFYVSGAFHSVCLVILKCPPLPGRQALSFAFCKREHCRSESFLCADPTVRYCKV